MDTLSLALAGAILLAALVLAAAFGLRAWQGWLDYKKMELASRSPQRESEIVPVATGGRIELADLKERVRKLEAIASGIDL